MIQIDELTPADYDGAIALWQRCEGIGLSDADERCQLTRFLDRNRGFCFAARTYGELVGTCLCGTDGRRGYLYHLAVDPQARRQGIAKNLVEKVFAALEAFDIHKCHIMVYSDNKLGLNFWKRTGWVLRPEIVLMSYSLNASSEKTPC